jgi:hypothetical protein
VGAHSRQLRPRHLVVVISLENQNRQDGSHFEGDPLKGPQTILGGPEPDSPIGEVALAEPGHREAEPKVATTIRIPRLLKLKVESAVLTTTGRPGGYNSFTSFVAGAIGHELVRLAVDVNEGRPFAPNTGPFRVGRPVGRGRG